MSASEIAQVVPRSTWFVDLGDLSQCVEPKTAARAEQSDLECVSDAVSQAVQARFPAAKAAAEGPLRNEDAWLVA